MCVCVFLSDVHPCWVGGWGVCRCHGGHESLFPLCYHMEATSITVRVGRFGMFGCSLVVVLSVLDPNIVRGPEVVFLPCLVVFDVWVVWCLEVAFGGLPRVA